ncbi:MAG: hypothetical protein H6Q68_2101 [Firmicutes bacterium]|nr:hypothetical protein [Bacillota bacterium]
MVIVFISILSLAIPINSTFAHERTKASVSVIFINNAKTTYDDELTNKISNWMNGKVEGLYNINPNTQPLTKLKALGFEDIAIIEKKDLVEAFADNHTDYIVYAGLQPFARKEKIHVFTYGKDMTATMMLKIVDVPNNKYLYNGKFIIKGSDSSSEWLIGNKSVALIAIDSILIEMGEVISFRLPLQPPNK